MHEDMGLTLRDAATREPERPWHDDLRGVVGYVRALAGRLDTIEGVLSANAGKPIRTMAVCDVAGTLLYEVPQAAPPAPRQPAILREIADVLAEPGDARRARDALVRTAVADLQRALGLVPDGLLGDQMLLAAAALHAGIRTPVDD